MLSLYPLTSCKKCIIWFDHQETSYKPKSRDHILNKCLYFSKISWKIKNGQETGLDYTGLERHAAKCNLWSCSKTWIKEIFAIKIYWGNWWNLNMVSILENSIASMLHFVILIIILSYKGVMCATHSQIVQERKRVAERKVTNVKLWI